MPGSRERGTGLVDRIRDVPAPAATEIGGYPADPTDALRDRVPMAFGLILLVTFALPFLMTGRLLLPLKAVVLDVLSLAVMPLALRHSAHSPKCRELIR